MDAGVVTRDGGSEVTEVLVPVGEPVYERIFDTPSFDLMEDVQIGIHVPVVKVEDSKMANVQSAPISELLVPEVHESEMMFLDELVNDENHDVQLLEFDGLVDLVDVVGQFPNALLVTKPATAPSVLDPNQPLSIPGLREVQCPVLRAAGQGKEKSNSEHNDNWSLRRADQLRKALQWDMSVSFGDLPFNQIDELLSNLFARVKKVKGGDYGSETLMNMLGGFNRVIRQASDLRSLRGETTNIVGRDFCIKKHAAFSKTRLTLKAVVQKTAQDGNNKKRQKVETLTECHEDFILADIDHQITSGTGVQKRLAFYLVTRCGVQGGSELYELKRCDIQIRVDSKCREYVWFEERTSKNNNTTLDRYKEEQFWTTYYSYEPDFVMTIKQYLRHMPPLGEGVKLDLFLGTITNPIGVIWFNRVHKGSNDRCAGILKNMAKLVGIDPDVFSNESGRATLITRMAARGMPDKVGMTITGHHTTSGYGRYDRTKVLKQEVATLVSSSPGLTYDEAFKRVSAQFVEEKLIGNYDNLNALMDPEIERKMKQKKLDREQQRALGAVPVVETAESSSMIDSGISKPQSVAITNSGKQLAAWHSHYDGINWDEEFSKNPMLAKVLGGTSQVSVANHVAGHSFNNISNCQITIQVVQPSTLAETDKENKPPLA